MKSSILFRRTLLIMLFIFGVIAMATSVLSAWILYERMMEEYISKGRSIARSLANTSIEVILNRDASTTQAHIDQYLEIKGVVYVFVVDAEGEIFSHTFVPAVPKEIGRVKPEAGMTVRELDIPDLGVIIDVSKPILAGVAGRVHVGMDKAIVLEYTKAAIIRQQLLLLAIFAISVVIMYVMVSRISRPLRKLTEYAEHLQAHDFSTTVDIHSKDEVGILADTMRSMAGELKTLITGLENTVAASTRELRDTLTYMKAIIDNLADGLLGVDIHGRITHFNPALSKMFGFGDKDLTDMPVMKLFDADLAELADRARRCVRGILTSEVQLPGERIGMAVATSIFDSESPESSGTHDEAACMGAVILIRDITPEKEVDRMKTEFISTVSHELRTPLTSIFGFAKYIRRKFETIILPELKKEDARVDKAADQVRDNLNIIISEGKRLGDLVNDVLDISKMESGKVEWRIRPWHIRDVIDQSLAGTGYLFDDKGLKYRVKIEESLPEVEMDKDRIIQVMVNLISNAVKFTPQGEVVIQARSEDDFLIVEVRDTGVGIAEDDLESVFDRFRQVGDTLTDKPKGTGLGLSIVKYIVETHGGQVWAQSTPGQGALFGFKIPFKYSGADAIKQRPSIKG